jgi:hypothetical protein
MSEAKRALEQAQTRLNRAACTFAESLDPARTDEERTVAKNRLCSAAVTFEAALEAWAEERTEQQEEDVQW